MTKHFHIHFTPRKNKVAALFRDQAPGSVPAATTTKPTPQEVMALVEALMQAIEDRRQGTLDAAARTTDAGEWDESKHPRGEGGKFSSAHHTAAAENHSLAAANHEAAAKMAGAGPMVAMHQKAAAAHKEAAETHGLAAKHLDAGTGLGEEFASQAHSKSYVAAGHSQKLESLAGGNMMGAAHSHLKKIASDPKQPVAKRAEAAEQLKKMEAAANAVANSPHAAKPQAPEGAEEGGAPDAGGGPAGAKPTASTVQGSAKHKTHQLLSSGHPFSLDELMSATGVTNKATILTALSDLKNPKYAGALGALQIAKRPDGMFHVTKAPEGGFKAVGQAPAGGAVALAGGGGGASPASAAPDVNDPHAVVHASHPTSSYMPGDRVQANVGMNKQPWTVLGHNAEGHVVLQKADGSKHRVDPALLGKMASKVPAPAPAAPTEPVTMKEAPNQAYGKAEGLKPGPGNTNVREGQPLHPELANAARRMGENPSTAPKHTKGSMVPAPKPIKGATATGQSFMQRVPISKAKNPSGALIRNAPTSELQKIASGKKVVNAPSNTRIQPDMNQKRLVPGSPAYKRAMEAKMKSGKA